jgi:RNA polymerase sigma factor (sigma-70 family)
MNNNKGVGCFIEKIQFQINNPIKIEWMEMTNEQLFDDYRETGDEMIKAYLVLRNVLYVIEQSNKYYTNKNVTQLDLIVAGIEGVNIAVNLFDPSRKTKFITFAETRIFKAMNKLIRAESHTVRIPENVWDDINKIVRFKATEQFREQQEKNEKMQSGEDALIEFICDHCKLTRRRYNNAMAAQLHKIAPAEFEAEAMETLCDAVHLSTNPETIMMDKLDSEDRSSEIKEVLSDLSQLEREIVDLRYNGFEKRSVNEVAVMLNISEKLVEKTDRKVRALLKPIAFRFHKQSKEQKELS